jgi:ABC-2 type transport system ATP-binding protein
MIEAHGLCKRYGAATAVNDLTFTVRPGLVTGFLGPNGAGKSTTMRMILGLAAPTRGTVTVNGRPYRQHIAPLREAGALLEARSVHPGRTAYHHLLALAQTHGIGRHRVREVIGQVGLDAVAGRRAGVYSLGMGQRLGIACALLGDPQTLVLDEPVNGLDPEGIVWMRGLLQGLAAEGRTVFVSSHLMNEIALTAERLIVIARGRLLADTTVTAVTDNAASDTVQVRTPQPGALTEALLTAGATVDSDTAGALTVTGLTAEQIGELAARLRLTLHELTPQQPSLEEAFMDLTRPALDYAASASPANRTGEQDR